MTHFKWTGSKDDLEQFRAVCKMSLCLQYIEWEELELGVDYD